MSEGASGAEHRAGVRFVVGATCLAGVLFGLYYFPYDRVGGSEQWFAAYLQAYARAVGFVLRLFEPHIVVTGATIQGRFAMSIVKSCDAMEANILFCAATLAFPGRLWRRAVATLVGLAALVAFNVVRLCCLYYVGENFRSAFDVAHMEIWPLLMVAFAVVDFVVCSRWLRESGPGGAAPENGPPRAREVRA
ncbi:MAG: archaeosortase/exosortase family protein [Polyangiaceae bacterium]|jgi:exosortase/archaeosortase family protein